MNEYGDTKNAQNNREQRQEGQGQSQGGLLNKIYTKMSGHPTCEVILNKAPTKKHYSAGDNLKGKICLKTAVEGQNIEHQCIRVSLLGMVLQHQPQYNTRKRDSNRFVIHKPQEITSSNINQYRQYTFMQIQKEVEQAGSF